MKEYFDAAFGLITSLPTLLFVAFASAALLYLPVTLAPPGAAAFIEENRGWIWAAFIVGVSGLFVRLAMFAVGLSGQGIQGLASAWKRKRQIAKMGGVLHALTKEEAALVSMFPSVAFHSITVDSNHPVVRGLRYKKVIAHLGGPVMVIRYDGFAAHELTDAAQAYLEKHPETFNGLDRDEALRIANCIMENPMVPYRGVETRGRDDGWRS